MATETRPLAPAHRARLAQHGLGGTLAGMLGGMSFLFNILKFVEIFPLIPRIEFKVPGTEPAWRAAHTGPIMNGMLLLVISANGSLLELSPREQQLLETTLLITVWGNTVGYNAAALGGERGLTPRGKPLNNLAYASFLSAALAVLTAIPLAMVGIARHTQGTDD